MSHLPSLHPHTRLPPIQRRAADIAGDLAARGLVDGPELLGHIVAAARQAAPRHDPMGLGVFLAQRFHDAARATTRERDAIRARIFWAVAPLLDRRAPGSALLDAAGRADPQGLFSPAERHAMVEDAILRALAWAARNRGTRR